MKLLFTIILLFMPLSFADQPISEFDAAVAEGYSEYAEAIEELNQHYNLKVYWGINNDELTYAIYFSPSIGKGYQVKLVTDGVRQLKIPSSSRGDVFLEAVTVNANETLDIVVTKTDGSMTRPFPLPLGKTIDDFKAKSPNSITGSGIGNEAVQLKRLRDISSYGIIIFILISVIVVLVVTIILLFVFKKGMFKERDSDVTSYDDIYQELLNSDFFDTGDFVASGGLDNHPTHNHELIEPRDHVLLDEEYTEYEYDVEGHLEMKGFNVNYSELTEAEKDKIMVELMILREKGMVSPRQYKEEVVKLWS